MAKTACYVDGFNLYHAIDKLEIPHLKWLNLMALARTFLRPGDALDSVMYFTAEMVWDRSKLMRHREFMRALRTVGVEPIVSKFLTLSKHCRAYDRYCDFREEKQTDVGFAARVIGDVLTKNIERLILVTADSDQVPTVATVRGLSPNTEVLIACPPGRMEIAKELRYVAHDDREISRGRMERCLFPRNVTDAKGSIVARCPAKYSHPEAATA